MALLSVWRAPYTFWWLVIAVTMGCGGALTPSDFHVQGLEEIEPAFAFFKGDMYAGVLPIAHAGDEDDETGEYMFWLFEPTAPLVQDEDSLLVWFNGGPGCSSLSAGLFFEMGPVTTPLHPAGTLTQPDEVHAPLQPNPHSWAHAVNVLYVEQPVGVGFSRGPHEPRNETQVGAAFDGFLQHFVEVFASYQSSKIFLVGESYAGFYVPSMAYFIHQRNKAGRPTGEHEIQLGGIALGNGWVDPLIQGGTVIDYAWWHGMIDSVTRKTLYREWYHCILQTESEPQSFHPFTVPDECGIMASVMKAAGSGLLPRGLAPNAYDVTTFDPYDLINMPTSTIDRFFNNPAVQKILHVPEDFDGDWMGCIPGAGRRRLTSRDLLLLDQDRPVSMNKFMVNLLDDAQIPILVYNGDRDLTTNSVGSELFLDSLDDWSGAAAWKNPEKYRRGLWLPTQEDDQQAVGGYSKEVQNLKFVIVVNSGHLVPLNRPVVALDLVVRLLEGETFIDKEIAPLLFDMQEVVNPEETKEEARRLKDRHILVAFVLAFAIGWFWSRFHYAPQRPGYLTVPTVGRVA
jgi:carboxypeptidase C (cathepsin A)